jgi:CheY-like chemotaxis protein
MPWIHARALRAGYILRQLAAGAPLVEVQSRLGHRSIDTTRRYVGLHESAAHVSAAARRTCGILVVDERQSTRTQLRLILEAAGHQVFEASDVVAASDMLRLSRLALVVLLALPTHVKNANRVMRQFTEEQRQWADHRVILITTDKQQIPQQLLIAASQDLPVVVRPLYFPTLFAYIAHAYARLGGSN